MINRPRQYSQNKRNLLDVFKWEGIIQLQNTVYDYSICRCALKKKNNHHSLWADMKIRARNRHLIEDNSLQKNRWPLNEVTTKLRGRKAQQLLGSWSDNQIEMATFWKNLLSLCDQLHVISVLKVPGPSTSAIWQNFVPLR